MGKYKIKLLDDDNKLFTILLTPEENTTITI